MSFHDLVSEEWSVGVSITKTDSDQYHCSLLWNAPYNRHIKKLDLYSHSRVECAPVEPMDSYYSKNVAIVRFSSVKNKRIIRCIESIEKNYCVGGRSESIPLSFLWRESKFVDGKFLPGIGETGLTCATFILSVFHSCGISLLKKDTWKYREEDVKWQRKITGWYNGILSEEEFKTMDSEIGSIRYRPEEVFCAALLKTEDYTPSFNEVVAAAKFIRSKL